MSNEPDRHTRVLVLIENTLIADNVLLTLNRGTLEIQHARDVLDACEILGEWLPQLAVVDIDDFGDQVVQRIATWGPPGRARLPVLAVTRRGDLKSKLAAFNLGVDDVMTFPLAPEELLARVLVISRRVSGAVSAIDPVVKIGELEIDIVSGRVRAGKGNIHLSSLELSLLYLLVANAGRIVTRDDILNAVWGFDYVSESNVVDRHVRKVRAKLGDDWRKPRYIATVPGQGYRFVATIT